MISVNVGVSLKQGSIAQTNIKHFDTLPFGYTCVGLELNLNPNSKIPKCIQSTAINCNPNKGEIKFVYKYSKMKDRNKMHISSVRVKDVK